METQIDMFATPSASFRDQLLAGESVVGSDGGIWKLARFGEKGWQRWGFLRTRAGEDRPLAWTNSGIRDHKDRAEAVDDLIAKLKTLGPSWRRDDEWWAARHARIEADKARVLAAIPPAMEVTDRDSMISIRDPLRDQFFANVYICDLANVKGHADNVIKRLLAWKAPTLDEDEPADDEAQDDGEQLGMAL